MNESKREMFTCCLVYLWEKYDTLIVTENTQNNKTETKKKSIQIF